MNHLLKGFFGYKVGPEPSYKLGYNSGYRGYNPSYLIIRPFIGVITLFITGRGPTLYEVRTPQLNDRYPEPTTNSLAF